ncbi:MAG: ABC transporter ATP-binding protein [Dysgonamonadaceae bacterium]
MSNIALEAHNISKQYRLGEVGTGTLSHDLNRMWARVRGKEDPFLKIGEANDRTQKGESDYVWALKDINFQIEQGDAVGIIGRNGAGKSTLLKLLSKVTAPTTGNIKVKGRIASLLEVGTGFHPEMTGRENIFLNGAILGMTKKEIKRKFDEIVDFSGVERYIDTPVKRYSSGMYVRLAFAVAAHLESEILIVDEVLAVGDAEFQKKCLGKMGDVSRGEGRTVLFVSHNMAAVKTLCKNGIYMNNGTIEYQGEVVEAIDYYNKSNLSNYSSTFSFSNEKRNGIHILDVTFNNIRKSEIKVSNGESIDIVIRFENFIERPISFEAQLYDSNDNLIAFYSPTHLKGELETYSVGTHEVEEKIHFPHNFTTGTFYLEFALTHPNVEYLFKFTNRVMVVVDGLITANGNPFYFKDRGVLILD